MHLFPGHQLPLCILLGRHSFSPPMTARSFFGGKKQLSSCDEIRQKSNRRKPWMWMTKVKKIKSSTRGKISHRTGVAHLGQPRPEIGNEHMKGGTHSIQEREAPFLCEFHPPVVHSHDIVCLLWAWDILKFVDNLWHYKFKLFSVHSMVSIICEKSHFQELKFVRC